MKKHPVNSSRIKEENYILDAAEIESPAIVFHELFSAYHLSDLREKLRDIMDSAFSDRDCDAQSYFFLFRHLEKLIEAAHVVASAGEENGSVSLCEKKAV